LRAPREAVEGAGTMHEPESKAIDGMRVRPPGPAV